MLSSGAIKSQKGQAMIFGLLFLAVVIMAMLTLFNQGQLVKNRVQLENAADATAYSQAKLAARNQNFIAYTNRAMVANEVSIGQMVALLSWAKHYKNVGAFVKYPAYNFPIAPPSPVTFSNVLEVVTLPYKIMGTAVEVPTKFIVDKWPTVISYFNSTLGVFQKLFALSTLTAQFEMNMEVLEGHEPDPDNPELYTPFIGWYFLVQNSLLTYSGDKFDASNLANLMDVIDTGEASGEDLVADFLGGQSGELHNQINSNSPSTKSSGDDAVAAYQRYAAIVNRNREAFTADRHWNIWVTTPDIIPEITLDFGIVRLTIDLDFQVGMGIKNDGGAAYLAKDEIEENKDIAGLGWSAIDVTSFGVEFDVGLFVEIRICLPIVGCAESTLLDLDFTIPIGFPLAGATHQLVSHNKYAMLTLPEWGDIGEQDGKFGGDPDDSVNDGPLDLFHAQALGWGQVAPELQPGGMYGARLSTDVTDSYAAPPGFLSLGENFQESGVGYELTVALAKSMDDVETSDNPDSFDIGNNQDEDDWDFDADDPDEANNFDYTRFDIDSKSRAETNGVEAAYQRTVWSDSRPMTTLSAAEVYFANPMQSSADGSPEPASLFSPFWDARLKEPSAVSQLIATGEVDWEELFDGVPDDAIGVVNWLLSAMAEDMIDSSIDYLKDQIESPFDTVMEGPLDEIGDKAKDASGGAVDEITDGLGSFL